MPKEIISSVSELQVKMKLLLIAAFLPLISGAITLYPVDKLIAGITDLQKLIEENQIDALNQIVTLRQTSLSVGFSYKNGYVNLIKKVITEVSLLDEPSRAVLAAENQTACILNLVSFMDNIRELSGYAISNCIEDKSGWNVRFANVSGAIDEFELDLNNLIQAILDGLIGRNSYTEPDAILRRQLELFNERLTAFRAKLDGLRNALVIERTAVESYTYDNEQKCFDAITYNVNSAVAMVSSQLAVCRVFSGRGQRLNVLLSADNFFPGVSARRRSNF